MTYEVDGLANWLDEIRAGERTKPDETLFSGACTRTDNLKSARDDVYHIRALLQGRPEPRLYGSVYLLDNDPDRPDASRATYLEGIKISAEGVKGRFEAVTDKNGLYSFTDLPASEYKVRAGKDTPPLKIVIPLPEGVTSARQ